jgi:hypothetical protein
LDIEIGVDDWGPASLMAVRRKFFNTGLLGAVDHDHRRFFARRSHCFIFPVVSLSNLLIYVINDHVVALRSGLRFSSPVVGSSSTSKLLDTNPMRCTSHFRGACCCCHEEGDDLELAEEETYRYHQVPQRQHVARAVHQPLIYKKPDRIEMIQRLPP